MNTVRPVIALMAPLFLLSGMAQSTVVYDNGPIQGITARNIGFGVLTNDFSISNSFSIDSKSTITGITFGAWIPYANTVATVDWAIGTTFFDVSLGSGVAVAFGDQPVGGAGPFTFTLTSFSVPDLALGAGTYFLTLTNGLNDQGGTVFWDASFGSSLARQTDGGTPFDIDSSAFQVLGKAIPEPSTLVLLSVAMGLLAWSSRHICVSKICGTHGA